MWSPWPIVSLNIYSICHNAIRREQALLIFISDVPSLECATGQDEILREIFFISDGFSSVSQCVKGSSSFRLQSVSVLEISLHFVCMSWRIFFKHCKKCQLFFNTTPTFLLDLALYFHWSWKPHESIKLPGGNSIFFFLKSFHDHISSGIQVEPDSASALQVVSIHSSCSPTHTNSRGNPPVIAFFLCCRSLRSMTITLIDPMNSPYVTVMSSKYSTKTTTAGGLAVWPVGCRDIFLLLM